MHVTVFFLVNMVVASAMGVMAYLNGHGAGGIAWRVIVTLIVLQAAYALWVLAVAWIAPPTEDEAAHSKTQNETDPGRDKLGAQSRDQVR